MAAIPPPPSRGGAQPAACPEKSVGSEPWVTRQAWTIPSVDRRLQVHASISTVSAATCTRPTPPLRSSCAHLSPAKRTAMCGIFGYVGQDQNAADLVLRGLKKLEYRGYDSWGVAVGHRDRVVVDKRIGKIGEAGPDLRAGGDRLRHNPRGPDGGGTGA